MRDEGEYLDVVGRIRKYDNDGNQVTNDTLGSGGSRREDGTVSKMAEDLRIRDEDDDENREGNYDPAEIVAKLLVGAGIFVAGIATALVIEHKSEIKAWFLDSVVAPVSVRMRKLAKWKSADTPEPALELVDPGEVAAIEPAELSQEIEVALKDEYILMGSTEAKQRFLEIVLALRVLVENMEALQRAVVIDDEKLLELQRAANLLTSDRGVDVLNRMLEPGSTPLDNEAQTEFIKMFGGGGEIDGEYLPIMRESIREVLAPEVLRSRQEGRLKPPIVEPPGRP